MGYRIDYGPMPKIKVPGRKTPLRLSALTALFLLVFVLTVKHVWPEGTDTLRRVLLPGEPTATEQAANALISDLREGVPFGDAVTVFCRQILDHGIQD